MKTVQQFTLTMCSALILFILIPLVSFADVIPAVTSVTRDTNNKVYINYDNDVSVSSAATLNFKVSNTILNLSSTSDDYENPISVSIIGKRRVVLEFSFIPLNSSGISYFTYDPTPPEVCPADPIPCNGGNGIYNDLGGNSPLVGFENTPVTPYNTIQPTSAEIGFNKITIKYGGDDFRYPLEITALPSQFTIEEIHYIAGFGLDPFSPTQISINNGNVELTTPNIDFSKDYRVSYVDKYTDLQNCLQTPFSLDCQMASGYIFDQSTDLVIPSFSSLDVNTNRPYLSNDRISPGATLNYAIEPFARIATISESEPSLIYFGEIAGLKTSTDTYISQNPFIKNLTGNIIVTRSPNSFTLNRANPIPELFKPNDSIHVLATDRASTLSKGLSVSIPYGTDIYSPAQLTNPAVKPIVSVKIQSLTPITSSETASIGSNVFLRGIDIPTVITLGAPAGSSIPSPADPTSTTFSNNITVCVDGTVTSFGTSDVSKIKIYSSNTTVNAAILDTAVTNKQFSLGGQFCFNTNHLTKYLITVEPTVIVVSSGGGGGGGGGGGSTPTTTPPTVIPANKIIVGSCKDINFPIIVNQKSKGAIIKNLEKFIQKYYFKSLVPDTSFKTSTISAIKLIQKKNKLKVTGYVNKETSDYFNNVFCKVK